MHYNLSDYLAALREQEMHYRKRGAFNSAVQCQRAVDYLEGGGEHSNNMCCWFDRGIDRRPYWHEHEHLLAIDLPNGLLFFMPKDVQFDLWTVLTHTLKLTSSDLLDFAAELYREEQEALKQQPPPQPNETP